MEVKCHVFVFLYLNVNPRNAFAVELKQYYPAHHLHYPIKGSCDLLVHMGKWSKEVAETILCDAQKNDFVCGECQYVTHIVS